MTQPGVDKIQRGIQSVEVGGALLRTLAEANGPLSLGELARRSGLSAAKAHPYLVSYGNLGLVTQAASSGHYDFGPLALSIGLAALRRLDPIRTATSGLAELVSATGQTGAIAVWGNHGPTVVHLAESDRPLHVNLRVGSVMSLANTATGQIFAAYLPDAQIAPALLREGIADSPTIGAGANRTEKLLDSIENVRKYRLSRTIDHPIPGVSAFSAPVFGHSGKLMLVITLLGPNGTFDPAWDGPIAEKLKAYADDVSRRLGAPSAS